MRDCCSRYGYGALCDREENGNEYDAAKLRP